MDSVCVYIYIYGKIPICPMPEIPLTEIGARLRHDGHHGRLCQRPKPEPCFCKIAYQPHDSGRHGTRAGNRAGKISHADKWEIVDLNG